MNKKGKIYTYSIVSAASEKFTEKVPYIIAIIETEGSKFLSRIDNYNENMNIGIGMEVELLAPDNDSNIPLCKLI